MHATYRQIDRLVLVHKMNLIVAGDLGRSLDDDPMLGAMEMLLQGVGREIAGTMHQWKLLRHSENRTRAPGLLPNPGCRPARLVRLHRRILQSSAASFRSRVYHPRTGRAPSRLIQCPPNRGKVNVASFGNHSVMGSAAEFACRANFKISLQGAI
jgi:hypothetical protein